MMKTIKTFLMIILVFSLFSCANDILDNAENPSASTPSADGKTYIVVDLETSLNSRTILPATGDFSKNKLTNITVKGKISGSNTNLVTLAHSENYSNFSGRIPIEAGAWDFTVTAELDGIPFKAEKNQTINAGTLNYLGFTLQADNTIYGGLKITTNFKGDANKVIVKLLDQDKQSISTIPDQTITDFTGSDPNFSFVYERPITDESKRLEDGTYYVIFAFYKVDENNASIVAPLNTYRSYVRIAKGVTTTATISIDLDEVYTITYNCWYNETSGFTESELEGLTFAGGAVFPEFYSRRSENIILPTPSLTGYTFDHWELDGQTITQITKGTTGDLEIDAFFTEDANSNFVSVPGNGSDISNMLVGKNLVTQAEYERFMKYHGEVVEGSSYKPADTDNKNTTPAYYVTFVDAIIYCNRLSVANNLDPVYKIGERTNLDGCVADISAWVSDTYLGVIESDGKYCFAWDRTKPYNDNPYWKWDNIYDGGCLYTDESADGYRLATFDEIEYIATWNVSNGCEIQSYTNINEWCDEYSQNNVETGIFTANISDSNATFSNARDYKKHSSHEEPGYIEIGGEEIYCCGGGANFTRNLGFRVVRNVQ